MKQFGSKFLEKHNSLKVKQKSFKSSKSIINSISINLNKETSMTKMSHMNSRQQALNSKISEEGEEVMLDLGDHESNFNKP
tara:strand:+ start:17 stop:259 length:243 start_codon:yes stop_codon:yes gene_type:complete